jgi:hypothetical protein
MKSAPLILSVTLAAVSGILIAQQQASDAAKVVFIDKAAIDAILAKGGPALTPRAAMVSRNADHLIAGGRRDAEADAERRAGRQRGDDAPDVSGEERQAIRRDDSRRRRIGDGDVRQASANGPSKNLVVAYALP